jgi:SAM-dependent methyltransferase
MPGVLENQRKWSDHNWEHGGHRWSPGGTSAGTEMMWWRTIRSRLFHHLPAGTVLEIAPGYGRWTEYLIAESDRLIGVDVTQRCIDVCRSRFDAARSEFHVNDGALLPMVETASIDFAFSLDSLVHVERPQVESYLRELARTLKPGGAAFLHHSNLGAYATAEGNAIADYVGERHWRAPSMSARIFRDACTQAGLVCVSQEVINWIGRDAQVDRYRLPGEQIALTDCFSTCMRPPVTAPGATRVLLNRRFVEEWREDIALTSLYGFHDDGPPDSQGRDDRVAPERQTGWRRNAAAMRQRWYGRRFARREPLVNSLIAGQCPDCRARASTVADGQACSSCRVEFVLG